MNNPFAGRDARYGSCRPTYPDALIRHLASLAPGRERAWDCGTGPGTAAAPLAAEFEEVIATDASEGMLAAARGHPRVRFLAAPAEDSGLPPGSVDLVPAAASVHWFDLDAFYREVRRVARPGGILAVFSYFLPRLGEPMDRLVRRLADGVLRAYWDERVSLVRAGYRSLPCPFAEIRCPAFACRMHWGLGQLLAYFDSWSASRRFREQTGAPASAAIAEELGRAWSGPGGRREVLFPIHARVGRVHGLGAASGG